MKNLLIVTAASIFIGIACAPEEMERARDDNNKQDITKISYVKDHRTGLCFAIYGSLGYNHARLTSVPCTDAVEKLVINNKQTDCAK